MTLQAPPHPMAVMRVLKQAARDYWASGNAQTLSINTPAGQAASAPITVTGTVLTDISVPKPVAVTVTLTQSATMKGTQTPNADPTTGAWSTQFAGGTCAAGATTAGAITAYGTQVASGSFTLT